MNRLIDPKSRFPELDLPLVTGGRFDLHESASPDKFTLLVVYRGLHCPKCKDQLQEIDPRVKALSSQGYNIVAASMDTKDRAKTTVIEWDIKDLPVAHDMSLLTAKSLGLFISDGREGSKEPTIFSEPGLFVIKPDGSLYAQYLQNTPFGRPDFEDIIQGLEFVIANDYPVRGASVA